MPGYNPFDFGGGSLPPPNLNTGVTRVYWLNPVLDPDLINDSLSSPPVSPVDNTVYIVGASATGAWTGLEGRVLYYNSGTSTWVDVLGRAILVGDRFGITLEHGSGFEGGNMAGNHNKVVQVTDATPGSYAYSFTIPVDQNEVTAVAQNSQHFGHGYTYSATSSSWVEYLGPISVTANRALVSSNTGAISASTVTSTELGRVSGVTSPIQTQIDTANSLLAAHEAAGDPHSQYATDSDLTFALAGQTTIPVGSISSTTTADSASTTFVDIMSVSVTLLQTTVIHGAVVAQLKAITSAAVGGIRVVIDVSNGQTMQINLANTTDEFNISAQHFSASLAAGTYTIKAQIQRVSGTGTVRFQRGSLFAQGQQASVASVSPSRMIYVSKNGGATPAADGSWSRPFASIKSAVDYAHTLTPSFNAPYAIMVASGVGSTTYSDTTPCNVTLGGLCVIAMGSPDFKSVQVAYNGSFIINMTGSSLFFAIMGIEVNCPATANWNAQPAALYITGTTSQRVYCGSAVLNSNATTRHAIYCDNSLATVQISDCEAKCGTTASSLAAINMQAGNLIETDCDIASRISGNLGTAIIQNAASVTLQDGNVAGKLQRTTNSGALSINGSKLNSGSNSCIETAGSVGSGNILLYDAILESTATYAVTGSELVNLGLVVYSSTFDLDPLLTLAYLKMDCNAKIIGADPAKWSGTPVTVSEAVNRLAAEVRTLKGSAIS